MWWPWGGTEYHNSKIEPNYVLEIQISHEGCEHAGAGLVL